MLAHLRDVCRIVSRTIGRPSAVGPAFAAALALAPVIAHAQAVPEPGWIGISIDLIVPGPPNAAPTPVVEGIPVEAVYRGSPADRAGIQPGSVILRIDDAPATLARLVERARTLEVGEPIVFDVRTEEGTRSIVVRAGQPPGEVITLQNQLVQDRLEADPGNREVAIRLRELQSQLMGVQSERARLRGRLESVRRRGQTVGEQAETQVRALDRQARDLEVALRQVLRDLRPTNRDRGGSSGSIRIVVPDGRTRVDLPPLPYAAGRDFVAGARLSSLNPALAEYFGGSEGILVLEVLENSPAGRAGLMPGDVITTANGRSARSVEELRTLVLGRGAGAVDLEVVRRGEELRVQLPR